MTIWVSLLIGCWVAAAAADMYHGQIRFVLLVALGTAFGWLTSRKGGE